MEWDRKAFGERLDSQLERTDWTAAKLAKAVRLKDGSSVSHWKNPESDREMCPTVEQLQVMARVLGVSPAWLAYGSGKAKPSSTSSPAQPLRQSDSQPLTVMETEALVAFLGDCFEKFPLERPLTIALQKIATMLSDGTLPAELPKDAGTIAATLATASKAAPASSTAELQSVPVALAASSSKPRKKGK